MIAMFCIECIILIILILKQSQTSVFNFISLIFIYNFLQTFPKLIRNFKRRYTKYCPFKFSGLLLNFKFILFF